MSMVKGMRRLQQRGKMTFANEGCRNVQDHYDEKAGESLKTENMTRKQSSDDVLSRVEYLRRLLKHICNVDASVEDCAQALEEGFKISFQCDGHDRKTRKILQAELYVLGGKNNLVVSPAIGSSVDEYRKLQRRDWVAKNVDPFSNFRFSVAPENLRCWPRSTCPLCGKRSKIYCPTCVIELCPKKASSSSEETKATPFSSLGTKVSKPILSLPRVNLPFRVEIVLHPQENVKKSTSLQLKVLSNEGQCAVRKFPDEIPAYDPSTTVLLFPDDKSTCLSDGKIDVSKLKTVVVVESTWQKAAGVARHPKLSGIPTVKIKEKEGTFWRYQELGNGFLSTLEATFYLLLEHWNMTEAARVNAASGVSGNAKPPTKRLRKGGLASASASHYDGRYDDLMLIYVNQHRRITAKDGSEQHIPRHWKVAKGNNKLRNKQKM